MIKKMGNLVSKKKNDCEIDKNNWNFVALLALLKERDADVRKAGADALSLLYSY